MENVGTDRFFDILSKRLGYNLLKVQVRCARMIFGEYLWQNGKTP